MNQAQALDLLKLGENVFLTGAAGSGKTWLLNTYIHHLRSHGVDVAITASTGIAATHLNGKTIHSWSGIGVRDHLSEDDLNTLAANQRINRNYRNTRVLVIDEISMLHPHQLDMVDQIARRLLDPSKPFGGLQMVLCGDFFQLPPVSPGARSSASVPTKFAYQAEAWARGNFQVCYLHEQHRQEGDTLLSILNDIRTGSAGEHTKIPLRTRYKREPEGGIRATRLYTHNVNVDRINKDELAKLDGREKTFHMTSRGFPKLVEGLKNNCLAPESLALKIGAEVMFIKNAPDGAFVNGTRGVVEQFGDGGWPLVRTTDGDRIIASAEEWHYEENGDIRASISQVPLRLAWAITIHKSQGMTLDAAEIDLGNAFEPGMGYVALSRVRGLAGLKLINLNEIALQVHPEILAHDRILQEQSQRAAGKLPGFAKPDLLKQQEDILLNRFGGSREKIVIKPGRASGAKKKKPPTRLATKEMLEEKLSLQEIADRRELTLGTILSHLEKLKGSNQLPDIEYLKASLSENDIAAILAAFKKSEDGKLTPIHRGFDGKYSFEDLRLARLFAW